MKKMKVVKQNLGCNSNPNKIKFERLIDVPGIKVIKPQRYVWHLTPKHNRKSILRYGLKANLSEHNSVFANNQSKNIDFFYPFCIDLYNERFSDEFYLEYDYWRIDTFKIKASWFIDPNMENGPKEYMGSSKNFIVTESSIPKEALSLYKIDARFLRSYTITAVMSELENGDREICYYGSKDKIDYSNKIIEIKELHEWDICRIREDIGDGFASFIVSDFPLVADKFYSEYFVRKRA